MKKSLFRTGIAIGAICSAVLLFPKADVKAQSLNDTRALRSIKTQRLFGSNNNKYNNEVKKILSGINKKWKTEEKLFYLHDYLVTHTDYDQTYSRYTAYDAIVDHKAVCQGYSLAFEDLVKKAGIPAATVTSRANNHAWNAVKVSGKWYYIDCTWDDPIGPSNKEYCAHRNFLRNEAGMRSTGHVGSDWTIGFWGGNVNGKYTDKTYENMPWIKAAECPVTLMTGSVAFYSNQDQTIYSYKCNRKKPSKLIKLEQFSYGVAIAGSGNTIFIGDRDTLYCKQGSSKTKKIYELSEDEKRAGNICKLSITGKTLRYDIGSSGNYFGKNTVKRSEYVEVSKAAKMSVSELELSDNSIRRIKPGESISLAVKASGVKSLSWTSDNAAVANVTAGTVTGVNPGTCRITVSGGGASDSCVVIVEKQGETQDSAPEDAAGVPDSAWISDFDKVLTDDYGKIYPMSYKGNVSELVIPATAVYEGKKYKTVLMYTILDKDNSTVTSLKCEPGVTIEPNYGRYLVMGNNSIKSFDLRGCKVNANKSYIRFAYNCPALESINLQGLDMTGVIFTGLTYYCDKLNTIVMPGYFDNTGYCYISGNWRVFDGTEYGLTSISNLCKAPANATLKLLTQTAAKGQTFTRDNITYKITDTSENKVTVTAIKGEKAVIPSAINHNGALYTVNAIAAKAAQNNKALKSVTIGSCITSIGNNAFFKCSKLTTIKVKTGILTKIGSKAFSGTGKKGKLSVPADCKTKYKKMWKKAGFSGECL